MKLRRSFIAWSATFVVLISGGSAFAHSGPPFPLVSNRSVGAYEISLWTDPDTTDDGTPAGQFWVTVRPSNGAALPPGSSISVALNAIDRPGPLLTAAAQPVGSDPSQRFAALVMDHEGRFHVRVTLEGPLGPASVEADVDATYDMRPSPLVAALYLLPFLLVGFLWIKLLLKRRRPASSQEE